MVEMTGGYLWVLPVGMSVIIAAIGLVTIMLRRHEDDHEAWK